MDDEILTVKRAAVILNVGQRCVRRLIKRGELKGRVINCRRGGIVTTQSALLEYVNKSIIDHETYEQGLERVEKEIQREVRESGMRQVIMNRWGYTDR